MAFVKQFPKNRGTFTEWSEIVLTYEEEITAEDQARQENIKILKESLADAQKIMANQGLKDTQTDLISLAITLFEKRASHEIYWKEAAAREKFDNPK